jgi:hypothetical protein
VVAGLADAGFRCLFLGIETPSPAALAETKKTQNLKLDLREVVDDLTRTGFEVMAGFIVGFDSDDASAFDLQHAFLEDAPIPMAMVGLLTALPDTALWRRLDAEGRLRAQSDSENFGRPNFATVMDEATLLKGYAALLERLYSLDGYLRRCRAYLDLAPLPRRAPRRRPGSWTIFARTIWRLGIKSPRRRLFWSLVGMALRRSIRLMPWAVEKAIQGEHFLRYTTEDVLPRLARALDDVNGQGMGRDRTPRRKPARSLAGSSVPGDRISS